MKKILICTSIAELPTPLTAGSRKRCDLCDCTVWVAHTSPKDAIPRCWQCVADTITPDAKIRPLTKKQLAEVKAKLT